MDITWISLYQNYGDDELYIRIILYFIVLLDSCDIKYVTIKFNNHPLISIISWIIPNNTVHIYNRSS